MKSENVKAWHLVRFMARLKFHRVPDLIVSIGKNTIRRPVDGPQINDNQLFLMFLIIGVSKIFTNSTLRQFVLPAISP